MKIGHRIIELRGKDSRRSFAKRIEIAENTLRNYEDGLSLPNSDTIATICKEFNVSADWLILGTCSISPALAPSEQSADLERKIAVLEGRLEEKQAIIERLLLELHKGGAEDATVGISAPSALFSGRSSRE